MTLLSMTQISIIKTGMVKMKSNWAEPVSTGSIWAEMVTKRGDPYLPEVFPLPLQNHFLVEMHITTAAGS